MAAQPLASASPKQKERYYLDTSVLFPLAHAEAKAAGQDSEPKEVAKAAVVTAFLSRAAAANAEVRTTVLAFEELGAKVRNKIRKAESASQFQRSWQDLKAFFPSDAAVVDAIAHAKMLAFMKWAADGAGKAGVVVERAEVKATDVVSSAIKLRKGHRALLQKNVGLDAMDALHIALGLEMAILNFVTFDGGWGAVPGINVFSL